MSSAQPELQVADTLFTAELVVTRAYREVDELNGAIHLEAGAVRALTWSRPATANELAVLAPILGLAIAVAPHRARSAAGTGSPPWSQLRVLVRYRDRLQNPAARMLGRRSLVVNPGFVESIDRNWMSHPEAVALLIYAAATHRGERTRAELAVLVATTPWRMVMGVCRPILAAFTGCPLGRWSWIIRGFLALICVAQGFTVGQPLARFSGAAVIVLTYAIPAADRELRRRTELAADLDVVRAGLGPVWLRFLHCTGHRIGLERRHRLQPVAATTSPQHTLAPITHTPTSSPDAPAVEDLSTRPRLWLVPTS